MSRVGTHSSSFSVSGPEWKSLIRGPLPFCPSCPSRSASFEPAQNLFRLLALLLLNSQSGQRPYEPLGTLFRCELSHNPQRVSIVQKRRFPTSRSDQYPLVSSDASTMHMQSKNLLFFFFFFFFEKYYLTKAPHSGQSSPSTFLAP